MYNALVLGAFLVSFLFDDLSGHSYSSTFLMFLIFHSCSFVQNIMSFLVNSVVISIIML